MLATVPSDVVRYIESLIRPAELADPKASINLHTEYAGPCKGIADLVRALPEALLVLDGKDRAQLTLALARIDIFVQRISNGQPDVLDRVPGLGDAPLRIIWRTMKLCPDEAPPRRFSTLDFVRDAALRTSIELDIGAAHRALGSDSFKAATVLGGAACEALLLWALQDGRIFPSLARLPSPPANPAALAEQNWGLARYIAAAMHAGILTPETAAATTLAQNYRNLIHPGRAQRLGEACDRGTALGALGALHRIIADLRGKLPQTRAGEGD